MATRVYSLYSSNSSAAPAATLQTIRRGRIVAVQANVSCGIALAGDLQWAQLSLNPTPYGATSDDPPESVICHVAQVAGAANATCNHNANHIGMDIPVQDGQRLYMHTGGGGGADLHCKFLVFVKE